MLGRDTTLIPRRRTAGKRRRKKQNVLIKKLGKVYFVK
jgi:hypothetical protein